MSDNQTLLLKKLPSVDKILKTQKVEERFEKEPKRLVLKAINNVLELKRKEILSNVNTDLSIDSIIDSIFSALNELRSLKLKPVVNATGIVLHTNLGRSVLSEAALRNIIEVSSNYSNLEYDLKQGKRGTRYSHVQDLLIELTGAEDAMIVNNNAAAVLISITALSKNTEVIVSRGELVEIGGSFRIPDIIKESGAQLKEIGTTNKTHLYDYERAITEKTSMLLKVHQSNYKMLGFTEDVNIEELVRLARKKELLVMFDLGSGCLIDLTPYRIYSEPAVGSIIAKDVDVVTFSADKLLGGPQAGIIAGKKKFIEPIRKHPLARVVRIDKLTLAAMEATLMQYTDNDAALRNIPTLQMLFHDVNAIKEKAKLFANKLRIFAELLEIEETTDVSQAGGGSLPCIEFPSYVVTIKSNTLTANELEEKLRKADTPVLTRISKDRVVFDLRTVFSNQLDTIVNVIRNII
ncbi:selenocysteine synthase [Candidatus Magnetoovum chiemensis]|nr:selenocysteine synthase [Candidatus Magnetoovum chiemensis]